MSGISTNIGLFSGIDTGSLIDQLLQIEARPIIFAQTRVAQLQQQQAAFLTVNSALQALESSIDRFTRDRVFQAKQATSSDEDVLTATATDRAAQGEYTFIVDRLVSTQQLLTRGFADSDTSAFGASSFTFESSKAALDNSARLTDLRGGDGISRGEFTITDRSGSTATIDASKAVNIDDIAEAINATTSISVTASIEDNNLVITDTTGSTASNLIIRDGFGFATADSLGIQTAVGGVAQNTVTGGALVQLSRNTPLSALNDGLGIMIRDEADNDLTITVSNGGGSTLAYNINLGEITQDFVALDHDSAGLSFVAGEPYEAPDPAPDGFTAPPLEKRVVQTRVATVGDLIDAIERQTTADGASSPDVSVTINADDGTLTFTDNTAPGGDFIIENGSTISTTATNLKAETGAGVTGSFTTGRLIAGANTVLTSSLNGGSGLTSTALVVTDRDGNSVDFEVDIGAWSVANVQGTLDELINEINEGLGDEGVGVSLSLSGDRRGLVVTDSTGGSGDLVITGGLATELGIATTGTASNSLDGASLQKQYVATQTRLEDFNGGVGTGSFRITDASGGVATIDINDTVANLYDVIKRINDAADIDVTASINANGDGILITDDTGTLAPGSKLTIEDTTGNVARNLNILGEFEIDESDDIFADGTFETTVTFEATDTLEDAARKISNSDAGLAATIINDGSGFSPFRLNLTSRESGREGEVLINTNGFELGLSTLSEGDDAVVFFGDDDPANAVMLTSGTNTLDNVIQGVSIDLNSTSTSAVQLSVTSDPSQAEGAIVEFVDSYNTVLEQIDQFTFFDSDSLQRGALFGDVTIANIERAMNRVVLGRGQQLESTTFRYLFEVGVRVGEGSALEFDSQRFRSALETDPDGVEALFSERQLLPNQPIELSPGIFVADTEDDFGRLGIPARLGNLLDSYTDSIDGILTVKRNSIDDQISQQEDRIENLNLKLDNKRAQLEQEFLAMERAIADLQSQSSALTSFTPG